MKSKFMLILVSVAGLMFGAQSALAASAAVKEMAGVMMHLQHYPSDAEKLKLQALVDDKNTTSDERVVATAILDLKHHAAPQDVAKLKMVMGDMSAAPEVRDLAGIVLNLSHEPSAMDKDKLGMMMK
jgi:hypothetical protein